MNYVVLSSNGSSIYGFYAPLTCAVWRARGYFPLLLLTEDAALWEGEPRGRLIREYCGAQGVYMSHSGGLLSGSATRAQVSRLFAYQVPRLAPDDYLLTSDIDMWPIGPWVGGSRDAGKALQIYYANAYEKTGRVHFPMCYLGATQKTWAEIMTAGPARDLDEAVKLCRHRPGRPENAGLVHLVPGSREAIPLDIWDFDESYFGECLRAWPGYPDACQLIPRDMRRPGERRIDRSAWSQPLSLEPYADAHLLRPGHDRAHWQALRALFIRLVPEFATFADEYYARFMGSP